MIVGDTFLWLHLPKTGGTSMNRLFHQRALAGVDVDRDDTSAKHDSVAVRENRSSWRAGPRRRFITARRLDHWLMSDWQHKRRHMNLPNLDFEPVRCGLFYSRRLGGTWVAADWWLQYFEISEEVTALRLEHLTTDLNTHLLPLLPAGTAPFNSLPRANARPNDPDASPADQAAKAAGHTATAPVFTAADRRRIAVVNPRWSRWQQQLYGALADEASDIAR